jgi:hypothetical protein
MKISIYALAIMALLAPLSTGAAEPFVGKPKTLADMKRCEIVQSTYSKKVYTRPKDNKIIGTMAPKWALCSVAKKAATPVSTTAPVPKPVEKTAVQLQLELEALNMALYGNPFGPIYKPTAITSLQPQNPVVLPPAIVQAPNPTNYYNITPAPVKPVIDTFKASATYAALGQSIVLTWEASNATVCVVTNNPNVTLPLTAGTFTSGSQTIRAIPAEGQTEVKFWVTCSNNQNLSAQKSVAITVDASASVPWVAEPSFYIKKRWIGGAGAFDHLFMTARWNTDDKMDVYCKDSWGAVIGRVNDVKSGETVVMDIRGWVSGNQSLCSFRVDNGPHGDYPYTYIKDPVPDYPYEDQ